MAMYPCKKHSAYYYSTATPGDVVTFDAPAALPILDGIFDITAVQASGTPTPSVPIPISGFTGMTIHVADGEEPHVVDNTYPVTWSEEGTLYGGYVKVNDDGSAELWKTHEIVDMGDLSWTYTNSVFRATLSDGVILSSSNMPPDYLCTCYLAKASGNSAKWSDDLVCWHGTGSNCYVYVTNSNYTDADVFATAMSGQKLVYKLATPYKVTDLTGIEVKTIIGDNNIYTDTGAVQALRYRIK